MIKKYKTATAFRSALETRLKNLAKEKQIDIQKLRRQVAFDRLLSRVFEFHPNEFFLKGGYSMELRIQKARSTKDIDLILKVDGDYKTNKEQIYDKLLEAVRTNSNDFFEFQIHEPTLDLEAFPYGGFRFPVEVNLDARLFVRFPIDIVISNLVLDPIENLENRSWLSFADIESKAYPTISKEQQFAEKLHAYTFPRDEDEKSRVKDLVDMFLLIESDEINKTFLTKAIKDVFDYRTTHEVPNFLIEFPENWIPKFDRLRQECGITENLDQCFFTIANFLNWPTITSQEKQATVPNEAPCHFCQDQAQVWMSKLPKQSGAINQTQAMYDFNCRNCGSFRISISFTKLCNSKNNTETWELWKNFLKNRPKTISEKRLLITTMNRIANLKNSKK